MKKFRILAILLALIIMIFTSCQRQAETNTNEPSESKADENTSSESESETQSFPENIVEEQNFKLISGGYELRAVYVNAGRPGPAVLLIAGSGPCDADETVGNLSPFADIAAALAENGISSLRFDKRTFQYGQSFKPTDGIEEEYLADCRAALAWLREQPGTESVYLLGHSLGGQIATVLAAENNEIEGMILWSSSARHLADIARDQYVAADPANRSDYEKYAAAAKEATFENAKGYYYYGGTDYYWASYNEINVADNIKSAGIPTLIINSTYDNQTFDTDIRLWQDSFGNAEGVTVKLYDDQSHFGYRIDTNDRTALYTSQEFPKELITDFTSFCK